jgi:hypothetical protein
MNSRALTLPNLLERMEGVLFFTAALAAYIHTGGNGIAFVVLLLLPDAFMVGYAVNPRVGAMLYNAAHTLLIPACLGLLSLLTGNWTVLHLALIWCAHIGMDRVVGYGFKYSSGFKDTHMQRI